jgi:hypothetical protein
MSAAFERVLWKPGATMNGTVLCRLPEAILGMMRSHRRLAFRLMVFPLLSSLAMRNWIASLQGAHLCRGGSELYESFLLVLSALTASLAVSIILVPPRLGHRTRPGLPVPPGLMLWYCCALLSTPALVIGISHAFLPKGINGWFFFVVLGSQLAAPFVLSPCGAICIVLALCFREQRAGLRAEAACGFPVWVLCLMTSLVWWCAPLALELP